jgi:hypothetical protein
VLGACVARVENEMVLWGEDLVRQSARFFWVPGLGQTKKWDRKTRRDAK